MIIDIKKTYKTILVKPSGESYNGLVNMDIDVQDIESNDDLKQLINELQKLYDENSFYGDIND